MEIKKVGKFVGIVLVVLVIGLVFSTGIHEEVNEASIDNTVQALPEIVSITIEGSAVETIVSTITSEETVLDVLKGLDSEDPELKLTVKEYPGIGILVEGMNGKINGTDSKYWQYRVNRLVPQIGADKFILSDGDVIEWYFGESEY